MACNIDLLCCGKNNFATPQEFYFASIALLCVIATNTAGGGGGGSASTSWTSCFQYQVEELEPVQFTRVFILNTVTNEITVENRDSETGEIITIPDGAVVTECPLAAIEVDACCPETNTLLETTNELLADPYADIPFLSIVAGVPQTIPAADEFIILPALGAGFRYQIRYVTVSNVGSPAIFDVYDYSGTSFYLNFYLVTGGIYATRYHKNDYAVGGDNEPIAIYTNSLTDSSVVLTIEYRIIPV